MIGDITQHFHVTFAPILIKFYIFKHVFSLLNYIQAKKTTLEKFSVLRAEAHHC